jgi:multidrug transporter EmrE-like cation transporter
MHRATDLPKKTPAPPEGSRAVSITSLGLVLFAVVLAACGQLMLKYGMQSAMARAHHTGGSLVIAVFVVSAMAWLGVLSRVPLSIAYPFNALGYIAILSASIVILHERANILTWVGSLIVVTGLLLVVLSKP